MRKLTKFLAGIILGTLMLGTTVFAAEEPIIMYTNATAALYTAPEADASKILIGAEHIEDGLPIFVKDFTPTAFYVVDLGAEVDYYIPMVSLNMFKEDALAADAFDKALADAMAVLASGELGNVNLLGETNNPVVNVPTQSQTQTQVPTQQTTPVQQTTPTQVANTGFEPITGLAIVPEGITSVPHTYGTPYYNRIGKKVVNSETDPFSVYLHDDYNSTMYRLETARALGYNYFITTSLPKDSGRNQAKWDFMDKYGITSWKINDMGITSMYIEEYDNMLKTSKIEVQYFIYTW